MNADTIKAVAEWMKSAGLSEVVYRKNGAGFSLTGAGAEPAAPPMPASRFHAVASETVGVFQWSAPGKARKAEEGAEVSPGDVLGVITTGSGAAKPVIAARAGRLAKMFIDAGQAVEYGQPLFLLEAR